MEKEILTYELTIDDINVDALTAIGIVNGPAIEESFMKFSNIKMNVENDEEKIITGPALIPNIKIFRRDEMRGEHYVYFSESTIKELVIKYIKDNKQNNVTIDHEYNANNISLFESWIIEDATNDKATALGFSDLPKGTWMVSFKIDNEEVWNQIKNANLDGFSIEGFLTKVLNKFAINYQNIDNEVLNILEQKKSDDEIIDDFIAWLEK